jgi:cation transporter-like permease
MNKLILNLVVIAIIGAGIAAIVTVFLGGGKKRKKVLVLVVLVRVLVPLVLFHYYTRIVSRLIEKDYLGL